MKRCLLHLLFLLLCCCTISSNYGQVNKAIDLVQDNQPDQAYAQLVQLTEDPDFAPAAHYGLSLAYSNAFFSRFNLDSAYTSIGRAVTTFRALPFKKRQKIQKKYSTSLFNRTKKDIENQAYELALEANSIEGYNHFLAHYPKVKYSYRAKIQGLRNKRLFKTASEKNEVESFSDLLKRYGADFKAFNPALYQQAHDRMLELYVAENGWSEFDQFAEAFPNNLHVKSGIKPLLDEAIKKGSYQAYESFLSNHQNTPFYEVGLDSVKQLIQSVDQVALYKRFLTKFPDEKQIWELYYNKVLGDQFIPTELKQFEKAHPKFPFPEWIERDRPDAVGHLAKRLIRKQSVGGMRVFLQNYKEYDQIDTVWMSYYALFKANVKDPKSLNRFLNAHPDFPFPEMVEKDRKLLELEQSESILKELREWGSIQEILLYLEKFPTQEHKDTLENRLAYLVLQSYEPDLLEQYLEQYPNGPNSQKAYEKYYYLKTENLSLASIELFQKENPDFPHGHLIKNDLAALNRWGELEVNQFTPSKAEDFEGYIKAFAPRNKALKALKKVIEVSWKQRNWAKAYETLSLYQDYFRGNNLRYNQLLNMVAPEKEDPNARAFSETVNSRRGEEFAPVLSASGQQLYFGAINRLDNLGGEDIYLSKLVDGEWTSPMLVTALNNRFGNEAPETISTDGTQMLLFHNGKLKITQKTFNGWSTPTTLPDEVNISNWQADAVFSADGKAILFASSALGYGGRDIYVSFKNELGKWQKAINLGPKINTSGNDRSPYLHSDMKTLYFSSDGHEGFGDLDVFVTRRLDDSWTNWSDPINLGYLFNSEGQDWGYKVTTDGLNALFSTGGNSGSEDIFICDLPQAFRPEVVASIQGKLVDRNEKPLSADIVWKDLNSGETIQTTKSDPQTGIFFATLPQTGNYSYTIIKPNYFPISGNLNLESSLEEMTLEAPIEVSTIEEMKSDSVKITLNNVFFETASFEILPTSFFELDRLVSWIKGYDLSIQLLGHTDNVGSSQDNLQLSQKRVDAVKEYLVDKGCETNRIKVLGFGETKPVDTNDTETGRAKNRRVEITILQNTQEK